MGADSMGTASLSGFGASYGVAPSARPHAGGYSAARIADRRATRRYAIDLRAHLSTGSPGARPGSEAQVINISSSGILIRSERPLEAGLKIRIRIDWPALLNNVVPLALHIEAETVRADGAYVGMRILRSEFRTRTVVKSATCL